MARSGGRRHVPQYRGAPQHGKAIVKTTKLALVVCASPCSSVSAGGTSQVARKCEESKIFARSVLDECPGWGSGVDWAAYTGELYDARNLVFRESAHAAKERLLLLIRLATSTMAAISECPAAIASVCYALAEALTADGLNPMEGLAFMQLGLAFLPIARHLECTQWPLHGRSLVAAFLRLAPKVASPLGALSISQLQIPVRTRIAVVTACSQQHNKYVRSTSLLNRQHYAAKFGYDVHFFKDITELAETIVAGRNLTSTNAPAFWRAHAVRSVLAKSRQYDWVLWLDCDVLITNTDLDVTASLASAVNGEAPSLVAAWDRFGVVADAFLLKPSQWSLAFLHHWAFSRIPGRSIEPLSERVALRHTVLPHWEWWMRGASMPAWHSFRWSSNVRLVAAGELLAPQQGATDAEPGAEWPSSELVRSWRPGDFAWFDPQCRGQWGNARGADSCYRRFLAARERSLSRPSFSSSSV